MRAVIVDDERLARVELRGMLAAHPDVAIVGEAATADTAIVQIASLQPELLFLDIEMPGKSGFDLLQALDHAPQVIFTTAYDEYALRAFDVSAIDFLVKPIRAERLAASLEKASRALAYRGHGDADRQIFVRDGDRCWFVSLSEVTLFESEGNYTRLYFGDERALVLRSLNYLEQRLSSQRFFRASRRHMVNLARIESIEPWFNGGFLVKAQGGRKVEMSRRRAQRFREIMSL